MFFLLPHVCLLSIGCFASTYDVDATLLLFFPFFSQSVFITRAVLYMSTSMILTVLMVLYQVRKCHYGRKYKVHLDGHKRSKYTLYNGAWCVRSGWYIDRHGYMSSVHVRSCGANLTLTSRFLFSATYEVHIIRLRTYIRRLFFYLFFLPRSFLPIVCLARRVFCPAGVRRVLLGLIGACAAEICNCQSESVTARNMWIPARNL